MDAEAETTGVRALGSHMEEKESGYIMRKAAGLYWLIDTGQPGVPYKKPLPMNETGARIYECSKKGMTCEEIAEELCREFSMTDEDSGREAVLRDVVEFARKLEAYGIRFSHT